MSSNINSLKHSKSQANSKRSPSLKHQKESLSTLSHEILNIKLRLWENKANKDWLDGQKPKKDLISTSEDAFFKDLWYKYEMCKGTKLERLFLSLIKAYEKFNSQSFSLSTLNKEKDSVLQGYQKITSNLSQENSLKNKIKSFQKSLEDKEKYINELEKTLKTIRQNLNDTKNFLDTCEVKMLLESKVQIIAETYKCIEDQKVIMIEINKIDQTIELEKNVTTITPEMTNKLVKKKISDVENNIAEVLKKIRNKEKIREKLRLSNEKMEKKNMRNSGSMMFKTCRSFSNLYTPNSKSEIGNSLKLSPSIGCIKKLGNLDDFDPRSPERDNAIKLLSKGITSKNSKKIQQALNHFGNDQQSLATRLVQLNRGIFDTKLN